jgi:hypothetical protein
MCMGAVLFSAYSMWLDADQQAELQAIWPPIDEAAPPKTKNAKGK